MATTKTETIEVQEGPTQEQLYELLRQHGVIHNIADLCRQGHTGICSCCGTTNPTKNSFKEYIRQGYEKFHKFIHWQYYPKGRASLPKEKENMLIIRDESGESMVLGWGDYK